MTFRSIGELAGRIIDQMELTAADASGGVGRQPPTDAAHQGRAADLNKGAEAGKAPASVTREVGKPSPSAQGNGGRPVMRLVIGGMGMTRAPQRVNCPRSALVSPMLLLVVDNHASTPCRSAGVVRW